MNSFCYDIVIDNTRYKVSFNKINTPAGVKYFVFAKARNGASCCFNMEPMGRKWKIINAPQVSDSLLKAEQRLSQFIELSVKQSEL